MKINKLNVYYHEKKVGTLANLDKYRIAFQYDDEWIQNGFSISPFSLPLKKDVFISNKPYFNGLFGVFSDSLPDAWGNILLNRVIRKYGLNNDELNTLDRLAIIGNSGMGALTYKPEFLHFEEIDKIDLDEISQECYLILTSEYNDNLDVLFKLGGSSGGARPKILTKINDEDWIIKFPAHTDSKDIGIMEYDYYKCALNCGIIMSESKLFDSKTSSGYFGTKRFDRKNNERIHMISAAALLEIDFRQPSFDYHTLMKLTKIITRDNLFDLEQLFRLMCFNVFSHNRDDHAKNFTYLYNENERRWHLSPAYDLTFSTTYYGEHTTSVDNNGLNPNRKELLNVGLKAGLKKNKCLSILDEIESKVNEQLSKYLKK